MFADKEVRIIYDHFHVKNVDIFLDGSSTKKKNCYGDHW